MHDGGHLIGRKWLPLTFVLCSTEYWINTSTILRNTGTCHIKIINIRVFRSAVTFQQCSPYHFKIPCNPFSLKVRTASNNFHSIISEKTLILMSTAIKIPYAGEKKSKLVFNIQENNCPGARHPFKKNWAWRTSFTKRPNPSLPAPSRPTTTTMTMTTTTTTATTATTIGPLSRFT